MLEKQNSLCSVPKSRETTDPKRTANHKLASETRIHRGLPGKREEVEDKQQEARKRYQIWGQPGREDLWESSKRTDELIKTWTEEQALLQPWLHCLGVRQHCQEHPEHTGAAGSVGLGCRDSGIRGRLQAAPHSLVAPQTKQLMVLQR